ARAALRERLRQGQRRADVLRAWRLQRGDAAAAVGVHGLDDDGPAGDRIRLRDLARGGDVVPGGVAAETLFVAQRADGFERVDAWEGPPRADLGAGLVGEV